jgi:hypothetical protein
MLVKSQMLQSKPVISRLFFRHKYKNSIKREWRLTEITLFCFATFYLINNIEPYGLGNSTLRRMKNV